MLPELNCYLFRRTVVLQNDSRTFFTTQHAFYKTPYAAFAGLPHNRDLRVECLPSHRSVSAATLRLRNCARVQRHVRLGAD